MTATPPVREAVQDVLVDRRGVIYMSEGNSGIYVFTHNPSQ